ncbi:MAG: glycoside hydrolase family 36 N-terminal domain-containing protein, partial [Eubacteriales bacterium]|nr:glycoside hydrolase family 36 N-terminal domain-containing protein [Eubacteriales bacterium]
MISCHEKLFKLDTDRSTYLFRVMDSGHLEHLYYGASLRDGSGFEALYQPHANGLPYTVAYSQQDVSLCLDTVCLETSGVGKGDFREPMVSLWAADTSFTTDFLYGSHRIYAGKPSLASLPASYGRDEDCQTLEVTLRDDVLALELVLNYHVFARHDVIARSARLVNRAAEAVHLQRLMSLQLDVPDKDYSLVTF